MKNNKLIAEFMGCTHPFNEIHDATLYKVEQGVFELDELEYHTSWDWLMPVVQKCYETEIVVQPAVEGGCSGLITFPLIGLPYMESTYNAVVKFIKEYNVDNADSEDDACDMLYGVDNNQ